MKKASRSLLTVAVMGVVMLATACGGGGTTTSSSIPPTTTTTNPPTTTTTEPPTTTSEPPQTLGDVAIAITTHSAAVMKAYNGLCQTCHDKGLSNSNPYPPTWDATASGSTHESGVFVVVPGSPADHTNYTEDQCTQPGCHTYEGQPTATTTTPPTTSTPPTTTSTEPTSTVISGSYTVLITMDGFQPDTLTVRVGTTITFTNNLEGDTGLECDALEVDTSVARGASYNYTFMAAGTYEFGTDEGDTFTITVVT